MTRKLIIDGNAVYEIDEECMLKRRIDGNAGKKDKDTPDKSGKDCGTGKSG